MLRFNLSRQIAIFKAFTFEIYFLMFISHDLYLEFNNEFQGKN